MLYTATQWHGINITDDEAKAWLAKTETPGQTLNNILESGLPVLEDKKAGKTLTAAQRTILFRIDQVVTAAQTYGTIEAECNGALLTAFGFKPASA